MNRFENARKVNSPNPHDLISRSETARSTVISSTSAFNAFSNNFDTSRTDLSRGFHNNPLSQSYVSQSNNINPKRSMVASQMMESTVFHTRKEMFNLSENRLAEISKKFLKQYGAGNEIRR